jgi:hypothetical protein
VPPDAPPRSRVPTADVKSPLTRTALLLMLSSEHSRNSGGCRHPGQPLLDTNKGRGFLCVSGSSAARALTTEAGSRASGADPTLTRALPGGYKLIVPEQAEQESNQRSRGTVGLLWP